MNFDMIEGKVVVVTGASGYVAGGIIQLLLEHGAIVRGTVRNFNSNSCKHLLDQQKFAPGSIGKLKLYEADLLTDGAFDECIDGADYVLHTASPFLSGKISDPQAQVVDPAIKGTENVLNSVEKTDTIKHVVVTSSIAAIFGHNNEKKVGEAYDETDWNTTSSLHHDSYHYSKLMAEKRAWEMQKENKKGWRLSTVNPGLVIGPSISGRANDGTFGVLCRLLNGNFYIGAHIEMGFVDVRDVAKAHLACLTNSEKTQGQRYLAVNKVMSIKELSDMIKSKYVKQFPHLIRFIAPKFLLKIFGPLLFGLDRKTIENSYGMPLLVNNSKIRNELGIDFIDIDQSVFDTVDSMLEHSMVKPKHPVVKSANAVSVKAA